MEKTEMKDTYKELYVKMSNSNKVENMKLFGDAFSDLFGKVADVHPDLAIQTLEMLNGINYNNYLSKAEAEEILSKFINQDNTTGAKWTIEQIKSYLKEQDLVEEEEGIFNIYALAVVMNMIYSDYSVQLKQILGAEKENEIPFWSYRFAIAKLHDKDKPCWVRSYFLK